MLQSSANIKLYFQEKIMKSKLLLTIIFIFTVTTIAAALQETEYFAVFLEGKKVGHAIQTRTVQDNKVTTTEVVSMTISRFGIPIKVDTTETGIETLEGKPLGFEANMLMSNVVIKTVGTVKDGVITAQITSMGQTQTQTNNWPEGALMYEGLRLLELKKGSAEGTTYSAKMFTPSMLMAIDAQITIGKTENVDLLGRIVPLTKSTIQMTVPGAGAMAITNYADSNLKLQKAIMPVVGMTIELVACDKAFALGKNDVFEVIEKMLLASPAPLDVKNAEAITYTLSPISPDKKLEIISTDSQTVSPAENNKIILTVKRPVVPRGQDMPYKAKNPDILNSLRPNEYLQSDDPKIIVLAKKTIGDEKDAYKAAKKIEGFVADYITEASLSIGYATASEVLQSKTGDCTEFAVLTAAMCRAVGIPARVAVGVAYVDEWLGVTNQLGGHAWTQVYIGQDNGKWIDIDAAFTSSGRGGFDPGHITLATGDGKPVQFFALINTLGNFKIEKAVVKKAK